MVENIDGSASFGWKYFHFIDKTGTRINIVEHETDIFGLEKKPYMTMIAKDQGKDPTRFKSEPNVIWERDSKGENGKFDFIFDNARFTGDVEGVLQHKELSDMVLYQDGSDRKSHWAVDVPYGKVQGILTTPQDEKTISGYMYQDRQWGGILIQEWVKDWTWTHLVNDKLFVVVFCINAADGKKTWHSISGEGGEISLDNDFQVSHLPKLATTDNPSSTVLPAEIKIPGKLSVVFSLEPRNVMRSRMNESHSNFSASYIRWSVDGKADTDQEVRGVAEYMRINKI